LKKLGIIVVFSILLIIPSLSNVEGFLHKGGADVIRLQPGESFTTTSWGLFSEKDVPVQIKLRVEGDGAELVSVAPSIILEPGTWHDVEITITVPADHPNNVLLTASVYALMEAPIVEGTVSINLQLLNILTIIIGEPVIEEKIVEEKSVEQPMMEEEEMETPQEEDKGGFVLETPEEQESTSQQEGGGCLISTATYGSELAPQVQMLREIRDNKLLSTESGSTFMTGFNSLYYSFSPTIADWERESPIFREAVKITLTPLITSLSILNYVDMNSEVEVLGYGISLILLNIGMYFVAPAVLITKLRR